jgi:microcystin-dependent protein
MADPYLGEIKLFSFQKVPQGWAQCAGQLLPINQNQVLFSLLGTTYGGDGRTNFALPDLRGRAPLAAFGAVKMAPYGLGVAAGADKVALTINNIPQHSHTIQATTVTGTTSSVSGGIYAAVKTPSEQNLYAPVATPTVPIDPDTVQSAGGAQAHSNMQPYLAMCYCIAIEGVYPPRP